MNNLVLALAPKFTKLQVLTLRQDLPQLQDNGVETIANHCHELQDLDLSKSFKLTDCSLYALAHGCPNLTKLNVSGCSAFSDGAVAYLAERCRKLRVLNLCGCVKAATDKALKVYALNSKMFCSQEYFKNLLVLLTEMNCYYFVQAIGYYCTRLQTVNLGWCDKVGDEGVMSLAYGCPDLRALDLCGCVLITGKTCVW